MSQNGHRIDDAEIVLFCYPPHSPALPDKKSPAQTLGFFTMEIQQDTYCQPCKSSFFLWIHLYDLLSIACVGSFPQLDNIDLL